MRRDSRETLTEPHILNCTVVKLDRRKAADPLYMTTHIILS